MKEFIKGNKESITIIFVSIIAFIVGCFGIGFIKSFLIIGLLDAIVFLYPVLVNKFKGKEKPTMEHIKKEVQNKINNELIKKKQPKEKNTNKKKKTIKIIITVLLSLFIAGIVLFGIFWGYVVANSPHFNPKALYQQESTVLYDKNGKVFKKLGVEKRENITYDELPEVLVNAIIATEDSRFFQHNGFDLPRFMKASFQALLGHDGGGASTLTMQLSKNAYTSKKISIVRKFTDIYMAIFQIEKEYTKQEILEFYVNYPYLGGGAWGVEQACQTYFGKSAKDINLAEAAMIAGLFQSPGGYDPTMYPEKAEKRRNTVLYLMERHGYITKEQREEASKLTVDKLLVKNTNTDSSSSTNKYDDFVDTVVREVRLNTEKDPYTVPMEIYTTMDPDAQEYVSKVMSGELFTWENDDVDAGIAVVDVKTGGVMAIGGIRPNHRTGEGSYNFAVQTNKQIGSTSKPIYDYATGIEYENWSTGKLFVDEPYTYSDGTSISNWDGQYKGNMTMREALAQSRNIPALKAFQQNKNANIKTMALNLGLHPEVASNGILHEAHAIGGYTGESPLTMAAAYAAFANEGFYTSPYSYTKIVYRDSGETVETTINKTKAMSTETAYMMTSLLQDSAKYGLGNQYNIGGAIYGAKTGTSNFDTATKTAKNLRSDAVNDLWVNGTSPDYAISVWYGYKEVKKNPEHISTVNTIQHRKLFQAVARGIFKQGSNFNKPDGVVEVEIEKYTDPIKLASDQTPNYLRSTELFKKGYEPTEVSTKYIQLENVTNLKGTLSGKTANLSWTAVSKQNEADNSWGDIVYKIYENTSGQLKLINTVSTNSAKIDIATGGKHKYVIKTAYQNYEGNMSSGNEVTVELPEDATFTLNGGNSITVEVGSSFTDPGYKVMSGSTDVTSKAKLQSKVITDSVAGKEVSTIDTSSVKTYTINYTIEYDGNVKVLTRSVIVTATKVQ